MPAWRPRPYTYSSRLDCQAFAW